MTPVLWSSEETPFTEATKLNIPDNCESSTLSSFLAEVEKITMHDLEVEVWLETHLILVMKSL